MKSDGKNLIPVIAQDARTNDVLMMAWADAEALRRTKKTGYMHYWSRSRGKYWKKGEESGHVHQLMGDGKLPEGNVAVLINAPRPGLNDLPG